MRVLLILLALAIGTLSCGQPQKGALSPDARSELDILADQNIDVREKYFRLAEICAQLLDEVAASDNDGTAAGKISEFLSDNDLALSRLNHQFDSWQKHENTETVVHFITRFNEQSSARTLRKLAPALHNRFSYNTAYTQDLNTLVYYLSLNR